MNTNFFNAETQRRRAAQSPPRGVGEDLDRNCASVTSLAAVFLPKFQFLLRSHIFLFKAAQLVRIRHQRLAGSFKPIAERPEVNVRLNGRSGIASWLHGVAGGFVAPLHLPPLELKPSNENKPCCKQGQCETGDYVDSFDPNKCLGRKFGGRSVRFHLEAAAGGRCDATAGKGGTLALPSAVAVSIGARLLASTDWVLTMAKRRPMTRFITTGLNTTSLMELHFGRRKLTDTRLWWGVCDPSGGLFHKRRLA